MKTFLGIFPLYLFLLSCGSDGIRSADPADQLPPATQTGEDTFACLINGKPFVVTNSNEQVAIYQNGFLQFGAGRYTEFSTTEINFVIEERIEAGALHDLTILPISRVMVRKVGGNSDCWYEYEDTLEGFVRFSKIDQTKFIVSGTFEFSAVKEGCDTVRITNGRFDMHYIP